MRLLKKIDEALPLSQSYRRSWEHSGKWDEPLCRAIQTWASDHPPDGSQDWEDALMELAICSATTRVCQGPAPAHQHRRVGALCTLRWLLPGLSFAEKPGSLDPDPSASVEWRQQNGYCVCNIGCGHCPFLDGESPYCYVHERRLPAFLPPLQPEYLSIDMPGCVSNALSR